MAKRAREESLSGSDQRPELLVSSGNALPLPPISPQRRYSPKILHIGKDPQEKVVIECSFPPHGPTGFSSFEQYEIHYQKEHVNRCIECDKNFPSAHYLQLHQTENHDPINEIRRVRGTNIFACFLEDCDVHCYSWLKRKEHLINVHNFPEYYDFCVINNGIDSHISDELKDSESAVPIPADCHQAHDLSRPREENPPAGNGLDVEAPAHPVTLTPAQISPDQADPASDLMQTMSVLRFIPRSVTLARAKVRAAQSGSGS